MCLNIFLNSSKALHKFKDWVTKSDIMVFFHQIPQFQYCANTVGIKKLVFKLKY